MKQTPIPSIHLSPETAYVVEDYPYGFRQRCKIRYWMEFSKIRGVRFASQTTNPKTCNSVWNRQKYSTYYTGMALYLDENNHVQWTGLHEYLGLKEIVAWLETWGETNHPEAKKSAARFLASKLKMDLGKSKGLVHFTINGTEQVTLVPELDWQAPATNKLLLDAVENTQHATKHGAESDLPRPDGGTLYVLS